MPVALSSQMTQNLVSLMSTNDSVAVTQNRLNTGKKVETVLDNAAVYFKARTLTDKADAYDQVNANITGSLNNVKVADKGLSTMYDNMNAILIQLKDAQSKAITSANAPTSAGGRAYGSAATTVVGGAADLDDSSLFQVGDIFSIGYKQQDGTTVVRYFRAAATAGDAGISNTGIGSANAITFNTAGELQQAVRNAFGNSDVNVAVSGTGALTLSTTASGTSVMVAQTTDAGTPGSGNSTIDFSRIFGGAGAGTAVASSGGSGVVDWNNAAVKGAALTYTGTGAAASAANLETRRQAADTYRATLQQLANIAKDSYMSGYTNLLAGNIMLVDLNEDVGDVVQRVSIGSSVDPLTLGFSGFDAATGNDNTSINNFNTDTSIGSAVTRMQNAMATVRIRQNALATHNTMMTTRLDFNKNFQKIMNDGVNQLTAADTTEEAANLAALQNRQAFATNNLSVTKQAEQSLLQLLR